jgi:ribosomal protein S18 acetylase RimI-like enzyme
LQRTAIIEGYLEWAKSFVIESEHGVTWLIKDRKSCDNVAFLACSFDTVESISELKLGGVLPKYAGHGIYADFVRYAQGVFKEMGIKTLLTSTQLQNIAVQRAWQKHGFRFDKSYETYHIINGNLWNAKMINHC